MQAERRVPGTGMAKIFWVEDQSHWIERFRAALESADFDGRTNSLEVYKFSEAARQRIALSKPEDRPDIAILDAHMNGHDQAGFRVSSALQKKWPGLPMVFLSEHSGTGLERDALEQYNARDFVAKHQQNAEEVLCWRIRAALRQAAVQASTRQNRPDGLLVSGSLQLDLDSWQVYWRGNKLMNPDNPRRPLAPTPRRILRCLVERSPRPVTAAQMGEYLAIDGFADATYRQHIKTLRRAFDAAEGGRGTFIERCKQDTGIVTVGSNGAYQWKADNDE